MSEHQLNALATPTSLSVTTTLVDAAAGEHPSEPKVQRRRLDGSSAADQPLADSLPVGQSQRHIDAAIVDEVVAYLLQVALAPATPPK